jgi:hypothetical protein
MHREARRITALAADLDAAFTTGVGWAGWEIWPHALGGRITYLDGTIDGLERDRAAIRAIDATGSTERLRQDIERMAEILRTVATTYRAGTIESYRLCNGEPIPSGAAGREDTPALGSNPGWKVGELRDEFTLLARTVRHRLDDEHGAERLTARWPITRAECEAIRATDSWGSEPQPIL